MNHEIRYGDGKSFVISPPESTEVTRLSGPAFDAAIDPYQAVQAAVDAPIEFPALKDALVAGDRIAIAADPETPQLAEVVKGLVDYLLAAGVQNDQLVVVTTEAAFEAVDAATQASVVLHRGDDQDSLSYLAASKEGEAIYVNRELFDADLVLLVTAMRFEGAPGYFGVHSGFFPTFSDDKAKKRFRRPDHSRRGRPFDKRCAEADEAAWLLGVQFTIHVAAAAGGAVSAITAGHSRAVAAAAENQIAAWRFEPARRAELVIATIDGASCQQTWVSFARTLSAAANAVEDNGCIVLCTELEESVGMGLGRLAGGLGEESTGVEIEQSDSADALAAAVLHEVSQQAHVYLLSRLDSQQVEDWGSAPINDLAEIDRLSHSFPSCILLEGGQFAAVAPCENADANH